jgi:actin-related protein
MRLKQLFFIFILFLLLQQDIFILAKNVKLTRQDVRIEIQLEKIKNVDFTSKDAIYELVKGILPEKFKKWKKANLKQDAVIFIKHQFNQENLKLKDALKVRETKILRLDESIKILEKEVENLEALDMGNKEILRRRRFKTEIDLLRRERFQLKYWFFEKEKDFDSHLLHKEKKQWSSYLFGTRKGYSRT